MNSNPTTTENTNISFNGKDYAIDAQIISSATTALQSHLSTVMNGTGATITIGGVSYSVDAAKLTAARNDFVSHLGTISGSGAKVNVNGVEYSVDSTKLQKAIADLESAFLGNESAESICPTCNGTGLVCSRCGEPVETTDISNCPNCSAIVGMECDIETCATCGGSGVVSGDTGDTVLPCTTCKGTGFVCPNCGEPVSVINNFAMCDKCGCMIDGVGNSAVPCPECGEPVCDVCNGYGWVCSTCGAPYNMGAGKTHCDNGHMMDGVEGTPIPCPVCGEE